MTGISISDRETVARQLGREPRALARVAARCRFGQPAVVSQRPYDGDGTPFPTTLWLTCRAEVDAVSRLESAGGVAELQGELERRPELRRSRAAADRRVQALRRSLLEAGPSLDGARSLELGLAGERPGAPIKCLHAHVAVALACPPYAFGELARARAGIGERRECCAWT